MTGGPAHASPFRHRLERSWPDGDGCAVWVMLNPSVADDTTDDPTIRRCIRFTRDWGYRGLRVVNLFAMRSTDPVGLLSDPVAAAGGWRAGEAVAEAVAAADLVVCAWGVIPKPLRVLHRDAEVLSVIRAQGHTPHHLGLTKAGYPRHPLYLPASTRPAPWERSSPR